MNKCVKYVTLECDETMLTLKRFVREYLQIYRGNEII